MQIKIILTISKKITLCYTDHKTSEQWQYFRCDQNNMPSLKILRNEVNLSLAIAALTDRSASHTLLDNAEMCHTWTSNIHLLRRT